MEDLHMFLGADLLPAHSSFELCLSATLKIFVPLPETHTSGL